MIINDKNKFLWFQPWKVASTTTYARLSKYDNGQLPQKKYYDYNLKKNISKHIFYTDFLKLFKYKSSYTKICFIRNPYDRFYAGYLQNICDFSTNKCTHEGAYKKLIESGSFKDWMIFAYNKFIQNKYFWSNHLLSEYCCFENKLVIDKIGYMENFDQDFEKICSELKLTYTYTNENVKYKKEVISCNPQEMKESDYRYLDKFDSDGIRIVNDIFSKDFELLNYKKVTA